MRRYYILAIVIVLSLPGSVLASSGRTDANGCHTEKKTGNYHCHGTKTKMARTEARTTSRGVFDDRNCADFSTQAEAQAFYVNAGGLLSDSHDLDRDNDGVACEEFK